MAVATVICPICGETSSVDAGALPAVVDCPRCGSRFPEREATIVDSELAFRSFSESAGPLASSRCPTQTLVAEEEPQKGLPRIPGYEVLGFVARGGMGVVLKARHPVLDRLAALKMPLPGVLAAPGSRERFLREARSAAHLRHPNICPIYEVGDSAECPFIAMAFIEGANLRDWATANQPTPRQAAEMTAVLARAVGYAHEHGVVHRDIKPANVMVDAETGEPVLTDFGLAKELSREGPEVTDSGAVVGTPAYMAPEQAAGRIEQIGPATDIYALGTVLYELLCGRPPFLGNKVEILYRVQAEEPVPPRKLNPRIHRDLETICLKALAKEPAARYESAVALADDLERFCAGEGILARRERLPMRMWRKVRRNAGHAVLSAAAVVLMATAGYFASRAGTTRKVAALSQSFEAALDRQDGSAAHLESAERLAAELDRRAPGRGASARQRLYGRFAESIRDSLRTPALNAETVAGVEQAIGLLQTGAPDLVPGLRQALKERLRLWEPVFDLKEPFGALDKVFGRDLVPAEGGALARPDPSPTRGAEAAEKAPALLSSIPCEGNVQIEARFDGSWEKSRELGLVLNAQPGGKGYAFLVRVPQRERVFDEDDSVGAPSPSFEAASGAVSVEILRNGVRLRRQIVDRTSIPHGPLYLLAEREGNHLTFQVNDLPPMAFQDVFAIGRAEAGFFGIQWPAAVRATRLWASRQALPSAPSPLESGDKLYADGNLTDALAFYRQQAIAAREEEIRQEVRHKEGLCLLGLQRADEAAAVFERLAAARGDHWPILAACQLWLMRLSQRRLAEADAIFESLSSRYRSEQLLPLIPNEVRAYIVDAYGIPGASYSFFQHIPDRVRKVELAVAVEDLLGHAERRTRVALARTYQVAGLMDKAVEVAEKAMREPSYWTRRDMCETYSWLMRLRGAPGRALGALDQLLFEKPGLYRGDCIPLLVERARVHAAMNDWAGAERDIEEFFRRAPADCCYRDASAASLLLGFLRERRGDAAGAMEAWHRLFAQTPAETKPGEGRLEAITGGALTGMGMTYLSALISLTGELSDADIETYARRLGERVIGSGRFANLKGVSGESILSGNLAASAMRLLPPGTIPAVVHGMWRSPRGREMARKAAFQELPFPQFARVPVLLGFVEGARGLLFRDGLSAEHEAILWQLANDSLDAHISGRVGMAQVAQALLAWKGTTNLLGWGGLALTLEPRLRGPAAYMLAHRYLQLKRPQDAAALFGTALADAPPDSPLKRLAAAELARLRD